MVKIRMTRMGRHKLPFYRIVAMDSRVRRDGAYIESFGTYDPVNDKVVINEEAVLKLRMRGIFTVVHIINGLPGENKEMMIETVKYLNSLGIEGIKIHMLYVSKDTMLAKILGKYT